MTHLTLQQLAAFLKLAETSSFGEAALQLGVSQPALSRTIQTIETRLGARLFDRDTRSVALTPVGERLRPLAERLLHDYDAGFRELDDFLAGRNGLIKVAALPSIASTLLPRAIASFQARFPSLRFELREDVGEPVHQAVRDRAVDFGLAPPPSTHFGGELRYQELFKDPVVLVCRRDDPLAGQEEHGWQVFAERPFISISDETGLRKMVESGLTQAGVVVERLVDCRQPSTVASLVAAGHGIAALTRLTMEQMDSPALTCRALVQPTVVRSIGLVWHAGRSLSPSARRFVREIEQQARAVRMRVPAASEIDSDSA